MSLSESNKKTLETLISNGWQTLLAGTLFEEGHAHALEMLKHSTFVLEFARKCTVRAMQAPRKPAAVDSKKPPPKKPAADAKKRPPANPPTCHPPTREHAAHTMERLARLRRTVVIVGGGFKSIPSMHLSFIDVQGLNVINLVDQLHASRANWQTVGLIFLLCDAEWSLYGSFATFEKLLGRLKLKAPNAKIYVTKIPLPEKAENISNEKLRRLKNFNYSLRRMSKYSCVPIHQYHLETLLADVRAEACPQKPHYLEPASAQRVMEVLVKRIESMATRLRRLGGPQEQPQHEGAGPSKAIRLEDLEKQLLGDAMAKQRRSFSTTTTS